MDPRILMLGWGFPPNVTGGLDTWVGEVFEAFEPKDAELQLLLPSEYAPEDREGIHSAPTGEGDIITRVGRMSDTFVELAEDADIAHTNDWFGYGPGLRAKRETDATWVSAFHSLSSDRNINPPEREVETERRVAQQSDVLISVSDITRQNVLELYEADSHVVHNGFSSLDTTGFDVKADLGIEGPMLLFVGRHTDQKGSQSPAVCDGQDPEHRRDARPRRLGPPDRAPEDVHRTARAQRPHQIRRLHS